MQEGWVGESQNNEGRKQGKPSYLRVLSVKHMTSAFFMFINIREKRTLSSRHSGHLLQPLKKT